jgi:YfiH family protein
MWRIESSPLGRIAVPPFVPETFAVFCTTLDFDGRITNDVANTMSDAVRERFGIEATLNTCNQIHGARIAHANSVDRWRECDSCDALWSDVTHVALGIKVADCLPVTMVDSTHSVIANAHSGWRGAVQRITAETVDAVTRQSAFDAASAYAYLGPSIRVCCFEVGEEVAARFDARYVDRSHAKPHVDLVAFTTGILLARGFGPDRISDSGLCTRCDGSVFHSFRRDGKGGGRNLAVVAQ